MLLAPLGNMLGKILGSGQLGKLATFVSPAFFDVMPARALFSRARQLYARSRDHAGVRRAFEQRAESLATAMPRLHIVGSVGIDGASTGQPASSQTLDVTWRANQIAELYFRQLFMPGPTLLDLRAASFTLETSQLRWHPAAWVADWSPDFIEPLREIYRGFYHHDDPTFRRGLAALSLSHSEDLFRQQFGANQAQVQFRVQEFIDIFQRVFQRCKTERTSLHPDFLPLGIYLAALYDHLQELDIAVDVAQAFARATANPSLDREATHA
jgi:hypothetical protein